MVVNAGTAHANSSFRSVEVKPAPVASQRADVGRKVKTKRSRSTRWSCSVTAPECLRPASGRPPSASVPPHHPELPGCLGTM